MKFRLLVPVVVSGVRVPAGRVVDASDRDCDAFQALCRSGSCECIEPPAEPEKKAKRKKKKAEAK